MKFIVLGAGVSGLATALTLLQRGHAVHLLDRGTVSSESSWAGAGILSPLLPWDYPDSVTAICLEAMRRYGDWVAGAEAVGEGSAEYWRCGMEIRDALNIDGAQDWCTRHDIALEIDGDTLWLPGIAQARNPRLSAVLAVAVRALGGKIGEYCEAREVVVEHGRAVQVRTTGGDFDCEALVVATGAWSGLPLAGLAAPPPVHPVRGQMLQFQLEPGQVERVLYRRGLYLVPRQGGLLLVGSTLENAGFDKSTDADTAQRLHAAANALVPELEGLAPIRQWAGLRPGSPDNLPLIDRHPELGNVWFNVGHFRYGVTMAPAAAAHLADVIEGATPALDPAPYTWAAMAARAPLVLP